MAETGFDDPRLAYGAAPIPGDQAAGPSLRYDPAFDAIEAEVRRMESEGPNAVRWQVVAPDGLAFLRDRSKDLLVAAYAAAALFRTEGARGLAVGLGVIDGMVEAHWDGLTPPRARERARVAALDWLVARLGPAIEGLAPQPADAAPLGAALEALQRLEARLPGLLQREQVALGDLSRPLRRHVEAFRQAEEAARRKAEAAAAAAVERQAAAARAAEAAARRAAAEAEAAEAARLAAEQEAAEEAAATEAAVASLAGPAAVAGLDPAARLAAIAAGLATVARARLAEGPPDFEAAVLAAAAALLRLGALRRERGHRGLPPPGEAAAADALAALDLLAGEAPHALAAWQALDQAAAAADDAAAVLPLRAAARLLLALEPGLAGEEADLDAATRDWVAREILPPPRLADPPAEAEARALALLEAGEAPRALALLAAGTRGAEGGRARFRWQMAEARTALAAGEPGLALGLLRHLDAVAQEHRLEQWEPDLAAPMLALACRSLAAAPAGPALGEEARAALHADAQARLSRLDIALALGVLREAPLST